MMSVTGLPPGGLIGIAVSVLLGVLVWVVGLPGDGTLLDATMSDLTLPAGLLVMLGGISIVGAVSHPARWRVVDAVVAAVLGVAGGFYFWGVGAAWAPVTGALTLVPPSVAILSGLWLLPGVLGALVVRKPGAALFTELVGSVLEALLGDQFGFSSVYYGAVQGLGVEFVLALMLYRRFGLVPAMLAGAGAGVGIGLLDVVIGYPELPAITKVGYMVIAVLSGALIAGAGSWGLTRALASTGALAPLASGRNAERV
jgi:energy-coupling factor transport system substrate-specific component